MSDRSMWSSLTGSIGNVEWMTVNGVIMESCTGLRSVKEPGRSTRCVVAVLASLVQNGGPLLLAVLLAATRQ